MMGSSSRRALYTGTASNLLKRAWEHKHDVEPGFTSKYKCHRLVFYENWPTMPQAIEREKEIKGWSRPKKNQLVESMNPEWRDLAADWYR